MNLLGLNFHGDPNIGLYGKASDKLCIVGHFISEESQKKLEKYLKVDVKKGLIAGTDLIGLFATMNSNGILLSGLVNDHELKNFEKIADDYGVNLDIIDSRFTAIGNLILCNDKGAVVSKLLSKAQMRKISDCLGVEAVQMKLGGVDVVGSAGSATNNGCLLHRDSSEKEIENIQEILKVDADIGTVNFGSPFVGAGIITNSYGTLIGDGTTAPEMQRIIDSLKLE
ncbi:MAG: translation initiation factor IF-6 [Candidatus Aenigmarchaeota archaeon]|nr:translation initiation factor IF-6 [Candidatus Aenigmarchaeota archaeon]